MLACPHLVTQVGLGCILLLCADIDYTFLDLSECSMLLCICDILRKL
jgi:hypothetical protein